MLQSVMSAEIADILGYLLPPWPHCFQLTFAVSTQHRPPFSLESGFILSCTSLLFRVHDRIKPGSCPCERLPPSLRSLSPSRHQFEEFTQRQTSHACLRSAFGVSHTLDGLPLLEPCELVSSHSHVRDSLFRGFPRRLADTLHQRTIPSCC
jgi:hypothetical protein